MALSIAETANWLHHGHRSRAVADWRPGRFALEDERTANNVPDASPKKLLPDLRR